MAIINFTSDRNAGVTVPFSDKPWPTGAHCPLGGDNLTAETRAHKGTFVRWLEHEGLCLEAWERNGYDDSDFLMKVWNPETQQPETVCYATTRFWTYPAYDSAPDATSEVRAAYAKWLEQESVRKRADERKAKAQELRLIRKAQVELADRHAISVLRLRHLMRSEHPGRSEAVLKLLKSKRLKNPFRIKLQQQLVNWLKETASQYSSPFSHKQWMYV
ncbi:hypothetical protein ACI2KR_30475 [Pseudomonas luteola]